MRIVYLGSGEFGVPTLQKLHESSHEILMVGTQPARPAGRGRKTHPTPIALTTAQLNLPHTEIPDVNAPNIVQQIQQLTPDIVLVIAFGQKIGNDLLNLLNIRWLNLHGSLLPAYRGAAPINWAIINGEKTAGITIIELNEIFDAGAILAQAATPIAPLETAGELHDRLAQLGPDVILKVIHDIENQCDQPLPQNNSQASKAPKFKKTDALIEWYQPAHDIACQCLGMYPWPGAYTYLHQPEREQAQRVIIARARSLDIAPPPHIEPGTLTEQLHVVCQNSLLDIIELRPQNGKLMTMKDFANGRHLQPSHHFYNQP